MKTITRKVGRHRLPGVGSRTYKARTECERQGVDSEVSSSILVLVGCLRATPGTGGCILLSTNRAMRGPAMIVLCREMYNTSRHGWNGAV